MAVSSSHNFSLESEYHLQVYPRNPVEFTSGKGAYLYDQEGNSYLDFLSGIAVNALGHSHPAVLDAIHGQLEQFIHVSNLVQVPSQSQLAEALCKATQYNRVFFCNSGTEANEALLKFVRKYWALKSQADSQAHSRLEIITFENSFHGRTCGALALTGQPKLQENFGPLVPGVTTLPLNDCDALRKACSDKTAAILMEPLLAEGGILTPSQEFVDTLHEMRELHGVILCADEIQTGAGRLGTFLGSHSVGYCADMISMAKPIGGGLPLGAVLMKEEHAKAIVPGDHGTTFGGNPVSCAAGLAVVKEIQSEGFLEQMNQVSKILRAGLQKMVDSHEEYTEIRGRGFLIGLETTLDTAQMISQCQKNGLIIARAGSNVLRFLPPLIITEDDVKLFLEKLEKSTLEIIGS